MVNPNFKKTQKKPCDDCGKIHATVKESKRCKYYTKKNQNEKNTISEHQDIHGQSDAFKQDASITQDVSQSYNQCETIFQSECDVAERLIKQNSRQATIETALFVNKSMEKLSNQLLNTTQPLIQFTEEFFSIRNQYRRQLSFVKGYKIKQLQQNYKQTKTIYMDQIKPMLCALVNSIQGFSANIKLFMKIVQLLRKQFGNLDTIKQIRSKFNEGRKLDKSSLQLCKELQKAQNFIERFNCRSWDTIQQIQFQIDRFLVTVGAEQQLKCVIQILRQKKQLLSAFSSERHQFFKMIDEIMSHVRPIVRLVSQGKTFYAINAFSSKFLSKSNQISDCVLKFTKSQVRNIGWQDLQKNIDTACYMYEWGQIDTLKNDIFFISQCLKDKTSKIKQKQQQLDLFLDEKNIIFLKKLIKVLAEGHQQTVQQFQLCNFQLFMQKSYQLWQLKTDAYAQLKDIRRFSRKTKDLIKIAQEIDFSRGLNVNVNISNFVQCVTRQSQSYSKLIDFVEQILGVVTNQNRQYFEQLVTLKRQQKQLLDRKSNAKSKGDELLAHMGLQQLYRSRKHRLIKLTNKLKQNDNAIKQIVDDNQQYTARVGQRDIESQQQQIDQTQQSDLLQYYPHTKICKQLRFKLRTDWTTWLVLDQKVIDQVMMGTYLSSKKKRLAKRLSNAQLIQQAQHISKRKKTKKSQHILQKMIVKEFTQKDLKNYSSQMGQQFLKQLIGLKIKPIIVPLDQFQTKQQYKIRQKNAQKAHILNSFIANKYGLLNMYNSTISYGYDRISQFTFLQHFWQKTGQIQLEIKRKTPDVKKKVLTKSDSKDKQKLSNSIDFYRKLEIQNKKTYKREKVFTDFLKGKYDTKTNVHDRYKIQTQLITRMKNNQNYQNEKEFFRLLKVKNKAAPLSLNLFQTNQQLKSKFKNFVVDAGNFEDPPLFKKNPYLNARIQWKNLKVQISKRIGTDKPLKQLFKQCRPYQWNQIQLKQYHTIPFQLHKEIQEKLSKYGFQSFQSFTKFIDKRDNYYQIQNTAIEQDKQRLIRKQIQQQLLTAVNHIQPYSFYDQEQVEQFLIDVQMFGHIRVFRTMGQPLKIKRTFQYYVVLLLDSKFSVLNEQYFNYLKNKSKQQYLLLKQETKRLRIQQQQLRLKENHWVVDQRQYGFKKLNKIQPFDLKKRQMTFKQSIIGQYKMSLISYQSSQSQQNISQNIDSFKQHTPPQIVDNLNIYCTIRPTQQKQVQSQLIVEDQHIMAQQKLQEVQNYQAGCNNNQQLNDDVVIMQIEDQDDYVSCIGQKALKQFKVNHKSQMLVRPNFKGNNSQYEFFNTQLKNFFYNKNLDNYRFEIRRNVKNNFEVKFDKKIDKRPLRRLRQQQLQLLKDYQSHNLVFPLKYVFVNDKIGGGFQASRTIQKNEPVGFFNGKILTLLQGQQRNNGHNMMDYIKTKIDKKQQWLVVTTCDQVWGLGPMFNHAPQDKANLVVIGYITPYGVQYIMKAKRKIQCGQHLTWNYQSGDTAQYEMKDMKGKKSKIEDIDQIVKKNRQTQQNIDDITKRLWKRAQNYPYQLFGKLELRQLLRLKEQKIGFDQICAVLDKLNNHKKYNNVISIHNYKMLKSHAGKLCNISRILVPIFYRKNHWLYVELTLQKEPIIVINDSIMKEISEYKIWLQNQLKEISEFINQKFDKNPQIIINDKFPQQKNDVDCGIFMLGSIMQRLTDESFSKDKIKQVRKKLADLITKQ